VLLSRKANQKREVASITKMMTFYTALKLVERFHSFLHNYGHSVADEVVQEGAGEGQMEQLAVARASTGGQVELNRAASSTSSTSNSIQVLAGQNHAGAGLSTST